MKTKFIEATNGFNYGKFLLARFDASDRQYRSQIPEEYGRDLLSAVCGWDVSRMLWVLDLQTGEGAYFKHGGHAAADLHKHAIWVCPLYEPFLTWLYTQPQPLDLDALPAVVTLGIEHSAIRGYRRPGPQAPATAPTSP